MAELERGKWKLEAVLHSEGKVVKFIIGFHTWFTI